MAERPHVRRVYGTVRYQERAAGAWMTLTVGARLPAGASVRTGANSSFEAAAGTRGVFAVGERSSLEIRQADAGGHQFSLLAGRIQNTVPSARDRVYVVRTATADVFVKGTEFDVEVDEEGRTIARSRSGSVGVRTTEGEATVAAGNEAIIERDGSISSIRPITGPPPSPFGFNAIWEDAVASAAAEGAAAVPPGISGAASRQPPEGAVLIDPTAYPASDQILNTRGELTAQDARRENGTYYDRYAIPAKAGEIYTVQLVAPHDAYLVVRAPGGEVVENDNGGRNTYNAQLRVSVPRNGDLEIFATTPNSPVTGRYRLFVVREPGSAPAAPPRPARAATARAAAGDTGSLAMQWLPSIGARRYRVYVLDGRRWKAIEETEEVARHSDALPRAGRHVLCVTAVGDDGESAPGENALVLAP
jgi:hypothetical protein